MSLSFSPLTSLEYFASLVGSDDDFPLFEAAVCVGQDEYADLNVQNVLGDVDLLLARLKRRLAADAGPLQKLRLLNQFFFHDLDFGGNANDFYDPDNSYIHVLLRSRRGIPISLALLWMELAQGLGLSVRGVAFPGHFMVKVHLPMGQAIIDPMTGRSLSREQLDERLEPFRRRLNKSDDFDIPLGLYLQAAPPREILARMLRNLKEIFTMHRDWERLLAVQERLIVLLPESWSEYRDRGLAHAELGHADQALADLECYLGHTENLVDVEAINERVDAIRRTRS